MQVAWRVWLGLAAAIMVAGPTFAKDCGHAATPLGLDHVVVGVADLDRASTRYRELGFSLKPGRPHDNGIRNQHVKFPDGTEIELLTAPQARDSLTREYLRHIGAGDGAVFLALYWPGTDLAERLSPLCLRSGSDGIASFPEGDRLRHIFFGRRNSSPTDRPQHFAHANTAESLVAIWLAGDDHSPELELLGALGAVACEDDASSAPDKAATVVPLRDGHLYFLPESSRAAPGRPIAGATVQVRNLDTALEFARSAGGSKIEWSERGPSRSITLPPSVTHGIWLELRESRLEPDSPGHVGGATHEEGR